MVSKEEEEALVSRIQTWLALGIACSTCAVAGAEEWPKWLGPQGTGISTEKIADKWPEAGPKKLWSQKVGEGFSTAVALNGKVYFLGMQGSNDVLTALNADSGQVIWAQSYPVTHKADQPQAQHTQSHLPLPEATPTIDCDKIYTYGGGGDLVCRNLADGKEVWKLNVLDATGASILQWNQASSPLVTEKWVYVQGGQNGAVAVAVDKVSGQIGWKAETGIGGYAAPIMAEVEGKPQIIIFGGKVLFGLDPKTGSTLWNHPWETSYDVNATTPIYHEGHLFISSGYGHGCAMLELGGGTAKEDWKGKQIASKYQPCILDKDRLYGNGAGRLKCITWPGGKQIWSNNKVELGEGGSFIIAGQNLIALSEGGHLSLLHLKPDGADVVSEADIFHYDKVWSDPIVYHGKLYVKGKDELACFDVK